MTMFCSEYQKKAAEHMQAAELEGLNMKHMIQGAVMAIQEEIAPDLERLAQLAKQYQPALEVVMRAIAR